MSPGNGQYFSINGGNTNLDTFNGTGGGDLGDWAGYTLDAFNAAVPPGYMLPISSFDLMELDALGYNLSGQAGAAQIAGNGVAGAQTSRPPPRSCPNQERWPCSGRHCSASALCDAAAALDVISAARFRREHHRGVVDRRR